MAHGDRAKANGNGNREYSKKRPCKFMFPDAGRVTKDNTHRLERREGKNEARKYKGL
jgi:hypothetical protein